MGDHAPAVRTRTPRFPRPPLALALAAAAYVGFRALVLHRNFDAVAIPSYEVSLLGNLAKHASEGRFGAPLHWYYDHCGGQVVVGLLAAPLYAALGDSYLTLKLVPLLLGLGSLALVWWILARVGSRRAAVLGVSLFVLVPPTLAKFSLIAQGNHFENLFFQLAAWALFLKAHERGSRPPTLFAAAAASGLAVFFYFGSLVTVVALGLAHLGLRGWRRSLADSRFALPGFLLGLAPLFWIWMSPNDSLGPFLAGNFPLSLRDLAGRWTERATEFLASVLPRAGGFEDLGPIPARAAEAAFLLGFAVAWGSILPGVLSSAVGAVRARSGVDARSGVSARAGISGASPSEGDARAAGDLRLAPLVLHLPLIVAFVGASRFRFAAYEPPVEIGRYRYLVPHLAFALMLIALAAARLSGRGGGRAILGRALAVATLATGLFTLPILSGRFAQPGLGLRYDGFLPRHMDHVVMRDWSTAADGTRFVWDHARIARRLSDLDPWERHEAYTGIGRTMAWIEIAPPGLKPDERLNALDLDRLAGRYAPEHGIDIARGAGSFLRGLSTDPERREGVARTLWKVQDSGHPLSSYVVEGLCLEYTYPLAQKAGPDLDWSLALRDLVPPAQRPAWARGFGIQCGRLIRRGVASDVVAVERRLQGIEPGLRDALWLGVGWGLADGGPQASMPADVMRLADGGLRAFALEGFARALRHLGGPQAEAPRFEWTLGPDEIAAVGRGHAWPEYPDPGAP